MRDKAYAMLQATANLLLFGAVFKTSIGIPLGHLPVVGFVHYHSLRYAYVYLFAPDKSRKGGNEKLQITENLKLLRMLNVLLSQIFKTMSLRSREIHSVRFACM